LLVDLTKHFGFDHCKGVRAFRIIKLCNDAPERIISDPHAHALIVQKWKFVAIEIGRLAE